MRGVGERRLRQRLNPSSAILSTSARDVLHCNGDRLRLSNEHHKLLAVRYSGIDQVPLKHGVVLRHHRNDDGGLLRALGFMDRRGIGGN